MIAPLLFFTDFGTEGPYIGQMKAAVFKKSPHIQIIDLMADVPAFNIAAGALLLNALLPYCPEDCVIVGVVDPGVGSEREPVVVEIGKRRLVGPDNGLFNAAAAMNGGGKWSNIPYDPSSISASFHGRDLFAPVAAELALGGAGGLIPRNKTTPEACHDVEQVIYIDRYGNAVTGMRADSLAPDARLRAGGVVLPRARTFSSVPVGQAFWYENSIGLAEIAINQGSAAQALSLSLGDAICRM